MKVSPLAGSRSGVVVSHENITERRLAELQLENKERMLSESQRIGHIGSWAIEISTRRLSWSDESYRIFGFENRTMELVEYNVDALLKLIHSDDRVAMDMWINSGFLGKEMQEQEFRIIRPDGSLRFILCSGAMQRDEVNRPDRLLGFVQDITERKQLEQQEKAHLDDLAHVTRIELMSGMASGIAHEVNQPLTAIASYTQVSLNFINAKNPDLERLSEILVKTHQQALRAGKIIHRMRDFLKSRSKQNSTVDINMLIQDSVGMCISDLQHLDIRLTLELEDNLPSISADQIHIEQVIINLIRNSMEALELRPANQQRHLSIQSLLTLSDGIQVRVKDNGPGISLEQQQKISMPFFTTKTTGMGMGLSISRSLIKAHNGALYFNSQPGKGTSFYFTLPLNTKSEDAERTVHLDQQKVGMGSSVYKGISKNSAISA
jgi:PAS domain S-box-containing protein